MIDDDAGAPGRAPAFPSLRPAVLRLLAQRLRGPWRVAIAERSMEPALRPGDWLLVDPTVGRWPRRGAIVVAREPDSDLLVVKRVAGRPGDLVGTALGPHRLAAGEAWLVGDAPGSHDSRHYGAVGVERLVARAWFRYGPLGRIGLLR